MKIVLATASKQRKDIFDMIGLKYETIVSDEEEISCAKSPDEYVKDLSIIKANSVARKLKEKAIIISADTVIYMDSKIYEKPKDKEEAFNNLKEMSGKITYAYTGITIKDLYQNKDVTFFDVCKVYIKELSDKDIKWYIEKEEKLLKVCGYALLGKASIFVDRVEGDYNTVFGISPSKIFDKLKELGYELSDFDFQ